jgi:hypothetical protein
MSAASCHYFKSTYAMSRIVGGTGVEPMESAARMKIALGTAL